MEIFMRTASPMGASVRFGITVICYICYVMLGSAEQNARQCSFEASEKLGETLPKPCLYARVIKLGVPFSIPFSRLPENCFCNSQ